MYLNELGLDLEQLLAEFVEEERKLLEVNASEQAISNRFSRKLEVAAQGWDIDCTIGICIKLKRLNMP